MWRLVNTRALPYLSLLSLLACGSGSSNQRPDPVPARPMPSVRLLAITDLDGALEPCGCNSRPLGGIDRMAARLAELRAGAPSLFVAAGNTLVGPEHSDEPAFAEQGRLARQTLSSILSELEVDAIAPGPADLVLGDEALAGLAQGQTRWLAAGMARAASPDAGALVEARVPALRGTKLQQVGDLQLGLFAVMGRAHMGTLHAPEDPLATAREAVAELRRGGAQVIIALVSTARRETRRIARIEGVDVVIQAGLDRSEPLPPSSEGGALVLNAGRQGQRLMVVDLYRRGEGAFTDASAWTLQARAEGLRAEATTLAGQIAQWEREGSTASADLERQRGRLADLERRAHAAESATERIPAQGNVIAARLLELSPDAPRDPAIRQLISAHDVRVGAANRRVWADIVPTPVSEGEPSYVGSELCGSCHMAALTWWHTTPHGHAYETLTRVGKEFDLECVGCHVTGYRRPGGSNVTHVENLQSVGCEVCHGPGSAHVAAPTEQSLARSPDANVCLRCHTEAHSDLFDFDAYSTMLQAPGHGLPETP